MIPTTYLTELATYTKDKIIKVVVNNTVEITSFYVRQVSDHTVELEYMITHGSVETALLIELKSAANVVISSNAVYIPITSDTIIKQKIKINEVEVTV
jgi:hypothetical protein